ncbi:MAG TPA: hypothetical protein VKG63_07705 [Steroidobacteraceae bacterium]|nr:hypothetical protein [Steroidobacteraceae bacterium]
MKPGEEFLSLTPKGMEALRSRASKLDANARGILSLIEQGSTSAEAILQRLKSPRDQVMDALRMLLSNRLVALAASDGAPQPATPDSKPAGSGSAGARMNLKPGISPSQAKFALSNFCLDQFGARGQDLADVVDLCGDVAGLQEALHAIRIEVESRCADRLPALIACVNEINETDF